MFHNFALFLVGCFEFITMRTSPKHFIWYLICIFFITLFSPGNAVYGGLKASDSWEIDDRESCKNIGHDSYDELLKLCRTCEQMFGFGQPRFLTSCMYECFKNKDYQFCANVLTGREPDATAPPIKRRPLKNFKYDQNYGYYSDRT